MSSIESIRRISGMFGIARWQWATLVTLGLMFAMSEGIGIGMLVPVLRFAEDGTIPTDGLGGVPARIAMALGLPVSLGTIFALAFVPVLARSLFLYGYQVFAARIRFRAIARLRTQGWDAFINARLPFVGAESHGRLVSVLTTEVDLAGSAIPLLLQFIENAVLLAVYVAVLVVVAPWLLPVVFVLIGVITAVVRVKMRQSARFGIEVSARNDGLHRTLSEKLGALRLIKMMGQEREETAHAAKIVDAMGTGFVNINRAKQIVEGCIDPLMALMSFAALYIAVAYLGMSLATLSIFVFVLLRIGPLLRQLNSARQGVYSVLGSLDNVEAMVARAREARDVTGGKLPLTEVRHAIVFDRVGFSYGSERGWALRDLSFSAGRGSLTAIVGRSGAGKSTLLDLIPRLREPTAGEIRIDDMPLSEFDVNSLRRGIGIVDQEGVLFNDTIAANIAYGAADVSRERIIEAARRVHAHHFIVEWPHGYDTNVGEMGAKLSVGQRQRLCLARTLLRDPEILLLDEPTSALDSESEQYIQETVNRLREDKVVIVVAHRLSTVRTADQIVVLDQGEIVERGDHDTLLARGGIYRQLFELQVYA